MEVGPWEIQNKRLEMASSFHFCDQNVGQKNNFIMGFHFTNNSLSYSNGEVSESLVPTCRNTNQSVVHINNQNHDHVKNVAYTEYFNMI